MQLQPNTFQHTQPVPENTSATAISTSQPVPVDNPYDVIWHKIKERATSRVDMTWLVVSELFTLGELRDKNVRGVGKEPLDRLKMAAVKKIVETHFPYKPEENTHAAWRVCEKKMWIHIYANSHTPAKNQRSSLLHEIIHTCTLSSINGLMFYE